MTPVVLMLLAVLGAAERFQVAGKGYASLTALEGKAPPWVIGRLKKIEEGLGARASFFRYVVTLEPSPFVVVTALPASRTDDLGKKALDSIAFIRKLLLDEPRAAGTGFTIRADPDVIELNGKGARAARITSTPVLNAQGAPWVGRRFDVTASHGKIATPDGDPARPGLQHPVDASGVLGFELTWPEEAQEPRISVVRVSAVDDPKVSASAVVHLTFGDDAPLFPMLFLLPDTEPLYRAVVDFVTKTWPQAGSWVTRPQGRGRGRADLPSVHIAYPPLVIVPDRKPTLKWNTAASVVHEIVHPLIYDAFGPLPYWLEEGLGWLAEERLLGSFRCFCDYHDFIYDVDHTGWLDRARRAVHRPADLRLEEVLAYQGELVSTRAEKTFDVMLDSLGHATIRALAEPAASNPAFRRLLLELAKSGRARELSAAEQMEFLKRHFGPDPAELVFKNLSQLK